MSPEMQTVARVTQTWLQASWHVQVPIAWLEACVEFLQEEAGGVGRLSQQQINQQALDQWLLTDLRDLDHPVLPEGISQAQKTELSGIFCVQVDSLLDVSQPAYSQLQSWRGTECANDQVSAVTQSTQRPWEAKPTRMLLLQVTDGVQSLEVMEYQPVPALSTTLRPGAKLQLKGRMVCRLGVLLLGPSNVKVLGGEVEDLVERNHQGRVLCRTLGLPEEEQQREQEEVLPAQQGNQEVEDLELDDAELLASLETQEVIPIRAVQDSGYQTLSDMSPQSYRSSSVRSPVPTASSRSEASARSHRNGLTQSSRGGPFQDHYHRNEQDNSDLNDLVRPERSVQRSIPDHNMTDEDFPDEDFDDLPLDELDGEMFEQSPDVSSSTHRSARDQNLARKPQSLECLWPGFNNSRPTMQKRDNQGFSGGAKEQFVKPSHESRASHDEDDFMDLDAECLLEEVETRMSAVSNQLPVQQQPRDKTKTLSLSCRPTSSSSRTETHQGQSITSSTSEPERFPAKKDSQSCSSGPAVTLTSPPFTYLSLLEEETSKQQPHPITIRVKAFIITLIGKLTSSSGFWRVCATISDGTGYLDVELSDEVLTGLLGFSVAEKAALKRDPARRGELEAGMRRCQEELVDMCCVMTIKVESEGGKAVVTKAERVSENVLQELEQRVKDPRK
ncbi:recQ-mediated genome instability protein 1 [Cheilinus undulatus]|uniref:recQ-mediated genome instability protein 1 n=1 Tax=Cheilinus undulatus TaxID=241271 RepID=UPI001BD1C009|nr:recQ-mediated genome instability protein 1 [Cheilinus undulatus]XP_041642477.1 recQ-mediated genome instability protein 1 [Cheilinus undulatus]XP_041642478.1 recQ-mediated genome instability protein 1 [Cheilinus undulatus]